MASHPGHKLIIRLAAYRLRMVPTTSALRDGEEPNWVELNVTTYTGFANATEISQL
jgi:hypothetical protein